ncbi:Hydrogenase maturation factor HypA, partial [Bienertia sinuspersici]
HGKWDIEKLNHHFTPSDSALVQQIPLSMRFPADERYWWLILMECIQQSQVIGWESWSCEWLGTKRSTKSLPFLWRACTGSLATRGRLLDHHVVADGMCVLCGSEYESIVHAIFECPEVKSVWENSPMATHINDAPKESFSLCLTGCVRD